MVAEARKSIFPVGHTVMDEIRRRWPQSSVTMARWRIDSPAAAALAIESLAKEVKDFGLNAHLCEDQCDAHKLEFLCGLTALAGMCLYVAEVLGYTKPLEADTDDDGENVTT